LFDIFVFQIIYFLINLFHF